MKKFIYSIMIAFVCTLAFTSCTEEEVSPATETSNAGGQGSDPLTK